MFKKITLVCMALFLFLPTSIKAQDINRDYDIQFDQASQIIMEEVFQILRNVNLESDEVKIDTISGYFIDTPYVGNRLVGSSSKDEELVIALEELDCFTYLDYLESFKRSSNYSEFEENLKKVRYIKGEVTYLQRKHFFSDWYSENEKVAIDVLTLPEYQDLISTDTVELNQGAKGVYIEDLPVRTRDINYLDRTIIDSKILKTFKTGDYVGLRKNIAGLDVTHTGLIVQKEDGTYLRHASSSAGKMKVVDELLLDYLDVNKSVIGILIFRSNAEFKKMQANITINYIDDIGNEVKQSDKETVVFGESYSYTGKPINGYNLISSEIINGIANEDTITLNFVYSPYLANTEGQYDLDIDESSRMIIDNVFELLKKNNLRSEEEKIDLISGYFLDTPYVADRLIGSNTQKEKLVVALEELDCFTYLDYIEAFRRSNDYESFIANLKNVRYINTDVNYLTRKHFYSDWYSENVRVATDVLAGEDYQTYIKTDVVNLNQGANGTYIPGLDVRQRDINYIPTEVVNEDILRTFKTGDYVGLRKNISGLDVTHTGLIIQKDDGTYLRHASSSSSTRKVVDQKLTDYLDLNKSVIGLLIFRSNSNMVPFESKVDVKYLDNQGNNIKKMETLKVTLGESVHIEAPKIKGYKLIGDSKIDKLVNEENITITFEYQKILTEEDTLPNTGKGNPISLYGMSIMAGLAFLYVGKRDRKYQ